MWELGCVFIFGGMGVCSESEDVQSSLQPHLHGDSETKYSTVGLESPPPFWIANVFDWQTVWLLQYFELYYSSYHCFSEPTLMACFMILRLHFTNSKGASPPSVFQWELTQDSGAVLWKGAGSGGCLVLSVVVPVTKRIDSNLRLTGLFVSC